MSPYLSVIIPCYNESENLKRGVLDEVTTYLNRQKYSYEVIISDDASSDDSREIIQDQIKNHSHMHLLANPHGGKAHALRYGLQKAKGIYVLFADMDQSTPISEVSKLLNKAESGYQVVIGSRGKSRRDASILRKVAARSFRLFRKSLLLRTIDDTQCGFKLANTKAAKHLFESMKIFEQTGQAKGWVVAAWDVEFLYLAEKFGYRTSEVKVDWSDKDETTGKDRNIFKFVNESVDMLKQVSRVKMNDWQGKYQHQYSNVE